MRTEEPHCELSSLQSETEREKSAPSDARQPALFPLAAFASSAGSLASPDRSRASRSTPAEQRRTHRQV